jgi:hypothetical protein
MLKYGHGGAGVAASDFSLRNASPVRELYFSPSEDKDSGVLYCDLALLDLDPSEKLVVIIENKLFGYNAKSQLKAYRKRTDARFKRCNVREFVYLTLSGRAPTNHSGTKSEGKDNSHWLCLSWVDDLLPLIKSLLPTKPSGRLNLLVRFLEDIRELSDQDKSSIKTVRLELFNSVTACLIEELNRLNRADGSRWKYSGRPKNGRNLEYTKYHSKHLAIRIQPNLSITAQSLTNSGRPISEKLYLPMNIHPDQILRFIDLFAREIYHSHFGANTMDYLSSRNTRTVIISETQKNARSQFMKLLKDYPKLRLQSMMQGY